MDVAVSVNKIIMNFAPLIDSAFHEQGAVI